MHTPENIFPIFFRELYFLNYNNQKFDLDSQKIKTTLSYSLIDLLSAQLITGCLPTSTLDRDYTKLSPAFLGPFKIVYNN